LYILITQKNKGGHKKMNETEPSVESWDGFLTNFLKAEHIEGQEAVFECVDVKTVNYPNSNDPVLSLGLQKADERFTFDLNVTNRAFLKSNGIKKPSEVVDKKLTISKVRVMNPTTKQEVDGLRITKIEGVVKTEKVENK